MEQIKKKISASTELNIKRRTLNNAQICFTYK